MTATDNAPMKLRHNIEQRKINKKLLQNIYSSQIPNKQIYHTNLKPAAKQNEDEQHHTQKLNEQQLNY